MIEGVRSEETKGVRLVIAGDSRWEERVHRMWPGADVIGVVKDLSLLEYMVSSVNVDFCLVDPELSPKGESLDAWQKRFKTAFPKVSILIGDGMLLEKSRLPGAVSNPCDLSSETRILTSQTVVVWSPKGGVGKTFFATNLACASAMATKGNTLLVDLDLYSGDVAVYLDLMEGPTITDLVPVLSDMRPDGLEKYAQRHAPTGLNVILSPRRPELSDLVTAEHIKTLLSLVNKRWGLVYIDTPPDITSDVVGQCMDAASRIVMVVTQDPAALRQSKMALDILWKLGIKKDMVSVVLNRASKDSPMSQTKVEDFLGVCLSGVIPEERKLIEKAVFQGTPCVLYQKSEIAQALWQTIPAICPGLVSPIPKKVTKERKGLFW